MRVFTKMFFTMMLLCAFGVLTAQAETEKVHATFENPTNTNTTWNAETKTFTWSTTYYNQLRNIGLPTGNISGYKKLVVDCEIKSGNRFRILFYKGGSNLVLYAQDGVNEFILADTLKALYPDNYNEFLLACDEICLSGDNGSAPGEVVINDVYLETYNTEAEKVYATFENPSNTNTTWDGETKTFTWSTTYYNQLRNIGLPTGDISGYRKLVVDCEIKSGNRFRILFYKGGSNLVLYAQDGVNEFILADTLKALYPDNYNEFLLACDEICLSGDNGSAPGEVVINAVYLETYPQGELPDIPEITYEEDPGKPEGTFVDFTEAFPELQPRLGLGTDGHPIVLGNGEVIVGHRSKDVIADLSAYSKLTIVTSPNLKLVLYMNHEIDAKQNAGDYTQEEAGQYVFQDVQANENGIIEVDLTQFDKQDLNCICLPWDNSNKGTVWYLLLTQKNGGEEQPETPSEIVDGVYDLTSDMFMSWTSHDATEGEALGCDVVLNQSTSMVYGDPDVNWLKYADLSAYDKFVVIVSEGTPRFCFNRTEDGAQDSDDPETTQFIDIPLHAWGTEAYYTKDENDKRFIIDLKKMTEERGFAHLHAIKSLWGQTVTVVKMKLVKGDSNVPTGITTVNAYKQNTTIYNLSGLRVNKMTKGLYVVDGKKMFVK